MEGSGTKYMTVPDILDAIERAEFAAGVSWPAACLNALWRQAKPKGTAGPEWHDHDADPSEMVMVDVDTLRELLREALAAELIRARARGESTVVIEAARERFDA